jgi:ABC-type phosphate/phosphonate transport system substrate-binding protein
MTGTRRIGLAAVALGVGLGVVLSGSARTVNRRTVRIGLIGTLFRDMPAPLVKTSMAPFRTLMQSQTGLRGILVTAPDAFALGKLLNANKLQLGVFHGFEFAWAQRKYPKLKPLVIAVNQHRHLRALVLVHKDSDAHNLENLKGKTLALPSLTREHCYLYLDRSCQDLGAEPKAYFSRLSKGGNVEDVLDKVCAKQVDAALVDGVALSCYKRRNPGRVRSLRILQKSRVFPAAVVAYHAGGLDAATLRQFRAGMIKANKTAYGRQMLMFWRMTGFEKIPADYQKNLAEIAKAFPSAKVTVAADSKVKVSKEAKTD